jgi:hypothetical protein
MGYMARTMRRSVTGAIPQCGTVILMKAARAGTSSRIMFPAPSRCRMNGK